MGTTKEKNIRTAKKGKSRHARRTQATRLKLLNAARQIFAEKGFDTATIDDITERADLGKGTFYYYFPDKQDVIGELIDGMMSDLIGVIEKRCEGTRELPDLIDIIVKVHIDFFSSRWDDFVLYFQGRADLQLQEGYSGIEKPFLRYLESIENLVESVINRQLPKPLLRRLGCAVAGFLSGFYSFAVISLEDEDVDKSLLDMRSAFVSSLTRFITEALSAEGAREGSG
jgi:AcrR family transcriptional regulator